MTKAILKMELRASFITSDKISLEHFPWVTPILKEPCVCVVTHIWQEVGGKTTKRLSLSPAVTLLVCGDGF